MKIELIKNKQGDFDGKTALSRLSDAGADELRVLTALMCLGGESEDGIIASYLGISPEETVSALNFWRGAGVVRLDGKAEKKTVISENDHPEYSGEELNKLFDKNTELRFLCDECQKIAGKLFGAHELNKIVSLYDYYRLSVQYILTVYSYCASKDKTSVAYVVKTALNIYDEGIDDDKKLEEYIKNKQEYDTIEGKVKSIFGIASRQLTKKESDAIYTWTKKWMFGLDMITYAYELTVDSTGKASVAYAGKILENWRKSGISKVEEAEKEHISNAKKSASQPQDKQTVNKDGRELTFDVDEFFDKALKHSYEQIGKKPQQ